MKTTGIALALTLITSISACSEALPPDDIDEAQQALGSSYVETTCYAEPQKVTEVGYCVSPSICTDTSRRCSGRVTPYYTHELIPCNLP